LDKNNVTSVVFLITMKMFDGVSLEEEYILSVEERLSTFTDSWGWRCPSSYKTLHCLTVNKNKQTPWPESARELYLPTEFMRPYCQVYKFRKYVKAVKSKHPVYKNFCRNRTFRSLNVIVGKRYQQAVRCCRRKACQYM
jgi:hypothetical protein